MAKGAFKKCIEPRLGSRLARAPVGKSAGPVGGGGIEAKLGQAQGCRRRMGRLKTGGPRQVCGKSQLALNRAPKGREDPKRLSCLVLHLPGFDQKSGVETLHREGVCSQSGLDLHVQLHSVGRIAAVPENPAGLCLAGEGGQNLARIAAPEELAA